MTTDEQGWESRTISLLAANIYAFLGIIPIFAITLAPFLVLHGLHALGQGLGWMIGHALLLVVVFIASIAVHEGLHVVGWMVFARIPLSRIKFGIESATPHVNASVPMQAGAYRISVALPGLILGVLPTAASWLLGSGALVLFGALMLITALGDLMILWLIRDVPATQLVLDHPSEAGCLVQRSN
jgi:hypothetical protein